MAFALGSWTDPISSLWGSLTASNDATTTAAVPLVARAATGGLATEVMASVVNGMDDTSFQTMLQGVGKLPAENLEVVQQALDATQDPKRQLLLFAETHKASAANRSAALNAGEGRAEDLRRRAAAGESKEIDEEVRFLLEREARGEPISASDVATLRTRKDLELDIEMNRAVNITNDAPGSFDPAQVGPRERRVWTHDALENLDAMIDKLPPEHVHLLDEIRRSANYLRPDGQGGFTPMSPVPRGAYQSDRHTMEIYDPGEMAPTTLVHETGHAFDYANPKLSQAFKDEAGWNAYGNPLALAEHLHDHEEGAVEDLVARLEAERKNPAMRNRTGASLDDKAYMPDPYSPEGYTEREAGAIPTPAGSEVMLGSQADEWGYARSGGPLEHFAEQYRLSILDPFTLYTDLMDRPATSGASEATRTSLADQWRVMREQVFGVTPTRVEEMAAGVGDVERFKEQARRCATQPQLEALRSLYLSGQDVRPEHVEQASATLAALPEAQRAAFLADARNCVTPSQLEDIRRSYAEGQRRDRKWVRP